MTKHKTTFFLAFLFSAVLLLNAPAALAADPGSDKIGAALTQKDLTTLQGLMDKGDVDPVVKALLKSIQMSLQSDPAYTQKKLSLAGEYAEKISPPSVPEICAELRRIAEAFTPEQFDTPLHDTFLSTAQDFAESPVVVAQGRPNLCEEDLLVQTPTYRPPSIVPPVPPPHPVSAD